MNFIKVIAKSGPLYLNSYEVWIAADAITTIQDGMIGLVDGQTIITENKAEDTLRAIEGLLQKSKKTSPKGTGDSAKVVAINEVVLRIVGHYRQVHPSRGKSLKPGSRDWSRIRTRLNDGFTEQDLINAIDGNKNCKWHQNHPAGHSIEYIFRNPTKVEGFIELSKGGYDQEEIGHHKGSKEFGDGDKQDTF